MDYELIFCTAIYGVNGRLNRALLPTAQSVIRDIAILSNDIATFAESCFGEISRTAAHLSLAYHQVSQQTI